VDLSPVDEVVDDLGRERRVDGGIDVPVNLDLDDPVLGEVDEIIILEEHPVHEGAEEGEPRRLREGEPVPEVHLQQLYEPEGTHQGHRSTA
jgi:hypothetical protein